MSDPNMSETEWTESWEAEHDDAEQCCICNRPATGYYDDREDCPSCGRAKCEYLMQQAIITCTSGTFTVTLPTAVGATGQEYIIRNGGAGTITIACNGAETINGAATLAMATQYMTYTLMSDGSGWMVV